MCRYILCETSALNHSLIALSCASRNDCRMLHVDLIATAGVFPDVSCCESAGARRGTVIPRPWTADPMFLQLFRCHAVVA